MPYLVFGLAIALVILCFTLRRVKTRARENDRQSLELEARQMLGDFCSEDVEHLREENAIMRNLLLDIIENEASLANTRCPVELRLRSINRTARRRELFGEAVVFLDRSAAPEIRLPQSARQAS